MHGGFEITTSKVIWESHLREGGPLITSCQLKHLCYFLLPNSMCLNKPKTFHSFSKHLLYIDHKSPALTFQDAPSYFTDWSINLLCYWAFGSQLNLCNSNSSLFFFCFWRLSFLMDTFDLCCVRICIEMYPSEKAFFLLGFLNKIDFGDFLFWWIPLIYVVSRG